MQARATLWLCFVLSLSTSVSFAEEDPFNSDDVVLNTGKCKTDADCKQNGWPNQHCIAVTTNRVGLKELSQCAPKPGCVGMNPGYCPSFQYWSALRYRQVQPVCVLIEPKNCRGLQTSEDEETIPSVDCHTVNYNGTQHHVIHGCQDVATYRNVAFFPPEIVETQLQSCIDTYSNDICNSCGTCVPLNSNNYTTYGCLCYEGFQGEHCEFVENGNCIADNQCGLGRCDQKTMQCVCPTGYRGQKCELCTQTPDACFGNGKCKNNGTCECLEGYVGKFCQTDTNGRPVSVNASQMENEMSDTGGSSSQGSHVILPLIVISVTLSLLNTLF